MTAEQTYRGACHCGNLRVAFTTARAPEELELRACQCSFCRRHQVRAATDPAGRVELEVRDARALQKYRFGFCTAEFWICRNCGGYVAAVIDTPDGRRATINVNQLDDAARFTRVPVAVDYDGETEDERRARRGRNWTPVT